MICADGLHIHERKYIEAFSPVVVYGTPDAWWVPETSHDTCLPVFLVVRGAAILRSVTLRVGRDPDLQETAGLFAVVHLLRAAAVVPRVYGSGSISKSRSAGNGRSRRRRSSPAHRISWFRIRRGCMAVHIWRQGAAWRCIKWQGAAWRCMGLHKMAGSRMALHKWKGAAWRCMGLQGAAYSGLGMHIVG